MRQAFLTLAGLALALTAGADPAPLTVGPHGRFATVQAAVDAALASGGRQQVRVERGLYPERLRAVVPEGQSLVVSGGWDARFAGRGPLDPERPGDDSIGSILDSKGTGPVVTLESRGTLVFQGFSVTGGGTPGPGALQAYASGLGSLSIDDNLVWGTRVVTTGAGHGIVSVTLRGSSTLLFRRNWIRDNSLESITPGSHANGGAAILALERSTVRLLGNHFLDNEVRSTGQANTAALDLDVRDESRGWADDNEFVGNRAVSDTSEGCCVVRLAAEEPTASDRPELQAERNQVYGNSPADGRAQLDLVVVGGLLRFADGVVADGSSDGLSALTLEGGEMDLTNLTLTGLGGTALRTDGPVSLANSLFFGNGTDLAGSPSELGNLYGTDPLFLDAVEHDYRLGPGSPAIDRGVSAVPGGLGPLDVYGETRLVGAAVDVGADEAPYVAGEPACRVRLLGPAGGSLATLPFGASAPACHCFSDVVLRQTRCGFLGPEVFVDLRLPLSWKAGELVRTPVTLHPWQPVASEYGMSLETLVGGKWRPQSWLGPASQGLKQGQLVVEPFDVAFVDRAGAVLRTTLKYQLPGGLAPRRLRMDVFLGDPTPQPN